MDKKYVFPLLLCIILTTTPRALGLMCYTCISTVNELTCLNDPDNVLNGSPTTDCQKGEHGCCTILRQEYLEEPGKIVSFSRMCQENCPRDGFSELPDSTSKFYQTYCSTPKCNIGPGNKSLSSIGQDGNGNGNIMNIPGEGAASISSSVVLLVSAVAIAMLLMDD
ncbi:uncharacterized protein [Panulirus ornatus]|uniref:uncharacterized protein n=1 Tax=Panulirus ornatus TaxID=150431 RepID=UPI003A86EDB5